MAIFSAYLPPNVSGDVALTRFELVPDGKAVLALLFPLVWLVMKRLWLASLVFMAIVGLLLLLAAWQPGLPVMYLAALPGLYLFLDGNELVRQRLERNGWRYAGVVDAENRRDAEVKFIASNAQLFIASPNGNDREIDKIVAFHPNSAPAGLFPE